jgi:hypothetical protein
MKRIQRKRTKGWRMPPNTVYVGRPSKWGNPFKIEDFKTEDFQDRVARAAAILKYEEVLDKALLVNPHYLDELKGKDLACWCPLDKPCHADVILRKLDELKDNAE